MMMVLGCGICFVGDEWGLDTVCCSYDLGAYMDSRLID